MVDGVPVKNSRIIGLQSVNSVVSAAWTVTPVFGLLNHKIKMQSPAGEGSLDKSHHCLQLKVVHCDVGKPISYNVRPGTDNPPHRLFITILDNVKL